MIRVMEIVPMQRRKPFVLCQIILACWMIPVRSPAAREQPKRIHHVTAYHEPGRFVGWPANHGSWSWGDECLVCFSRGYSQDNGVDYHIDKSKPEDFLFARSVDGGLSWTIETPNPPGALMGTRGQRHAAMPEGLEDEVPVALTESIDFSHPDFAMIVRMDHSRGGVSRFSISSDRGKSWRGPFHLPLLGHKGMMARTDYILNGPRDCFLFVTVTKSDGTEGRPIAIQTTDGGLKWNQAGSIGLEPSGFAVTPSTIRISTNDFLCALRMRDGARQYIDIYGSHDLGSNWSFISTPVVSTGEGNPPCLVRLTDGRIVLTYGVRAKPYRVEARLSCDVGKTWSEPFVVRGNGASKDVGYVRSFVRSDGNVITVYVFLEPGKIDCTLEATIWNPGSP